MMIKSGYEEGLFFQSSLPVSTGELEENIRTLLIKNHGVGIIGGYYAPGFPICLVSELTLKLLGYCNPDEFESATNGLFTSLIAEGGFSADDFHALRDTVEFNMRSIDGIVWVRLVKQDLRCSNGQVLWLASVCDMTALYNRQLLMERIEAEKQAALKEAYESEKAAHCAALKAQDRAEKLLAEVQKLNCELERKQDELTAANRSLELQKAKLESACADAQRANAAKSDFLARMSHDIRTPINGILGLSEVSEHFENDPAKLKELRKKGRAVAWHLLSLVNDILDMSKLESGCIELAEEPFDLNELLDQCRDIVAQQAAELKVTLVSENHVPSADAGLIGSPLHVRQILTNILSNAIKYNRENGSVSVSIDELERCGERVLIRFTVSDTGIGISEEFQKKIFEPFSREKSDPENPVEGTGLGMAIVKKLTDKMGGSIAVKSRPGEGSTFTVVLPFLIDESAAPEPASEASHTAAASLNGINILLVEDNQLNMEIAEFLLRKAGAEITKATNGSEAVDIFSESREGFFSVILMDIMMPVMDGCTASRVIRSLPRRDAASVPIIAMTANAFTEGVKKCCAAGMNSHLAKPFKPENLISIIAELTQK